MPRVHDQKNKECLFEETCPVCGYYCVGNGGFGCIHKENVSCTCPPTIQHEEGCPCATKNHQNIEPNCPWCTCNKKEKLHAKFTMDGSHTADSFPVEVKITPTQQHDPENKECHCNAYEGHPQCSLCTCSHQESLDKCYLIWGEDGALTCNYNHKAGDKCLVSVRQEEELREAYEKQGDIETCSKHYVKDCPECFLQEKQDWETHFDTTFTEDTFCACGGEYDNERHRTAVKAFIRKEKELSKEEGRREGYEDGKALRGKEWKQDIEEVRLEVIGAVEDYVRRYYVLHKNDGKPLIEKADILALLDSLKNNSKL